MFSSCNVHSGVENTRRDDLESLAYTLMYCLGRSLPWQHLDADPTQEEELVFWDLKQATDLCSGLPAEFGVFLQYVRGLQFDEHPDYSYIRALFGDLERNAGFSPSNLVFDWAADEPDMSCHCYCPHYARHCNRITTLSKMTVIQAYP